LVFALLGITLSVSNQKHGQKKAKAKPIKAKQIPSKSKGKQSRAKAKASKTKAKQSQNTYQHRTKQTSCASPKSNYKKVQRNVDCILIAFFIIVELHFVCILIPFRLPLIA